MKILVVGAGSMGCLLGGYLSRAGHDVFLLDSQPERVEAIAQHGLSVEGVGGDFQVEPAAGLQYDGDPPELVLITVKAYDTARAAEPLAVLLGEATTVLTLQNGVGNIERLASHLPRESLLAGTTSLGANLLASGRVHHAGEGETHLGELDGEISERVTQLAEIFTRAKLPAQATDNVQELIWKKLAVNVGINALTALLRVRNGQLLATDDAQQIMRDAVTECVLVAQSSGIPLELEPIYQRVRDVARATANNRSSMLMDVLHNRRTEIDAINGAVVHRAEELGLATPVNQTLTRLIHALDDLKDATER